MPNKTVPARNMLAIVRRRQAEGVLRRLAAVRAAGGRAMAHEASRLFWRGRCAGASTRTFFEQGGVQPLQTITTAAGVIAAAATTR